MKYWGDGEVTCTCYEAETVLRMDGRVFCNGCLSELPEQALVDTGTHGWCLDPSHSAQCTYDCPEPLKTPNKKQSK